MSDDVSGEGVSNGVSDERVNSGFDLSEIKFRKLTIHMVKFGNV